jgi:DNA invertase Pin-like site-specific DNA recombinase/uncharacterized coiled-coil protein SlyX
MTNETLLKQFAKGHTNSKKDTSGLNCVIYTRVSSKEQADTNQSLEWQKKYCLNYAIKNNFKILGYFGGTYESAKSDERKEFSRMLKFVKSQKEKVSYILVYSLDRFSRTGDSAIYIASELKKSGVNILAVTQPIDTNSHAGSLQQNIQFIFSKYDNDLRRQKTVDGMREKLLRGEWLGNVPTGYAYDKTHGTKEQKIVITEKGWFVKQAFEWRAEGRSYEEIVDKLEKLEFRIPFQLLTDMFRNPFYCGLISHNLLNGEIVKGKHPALISEELFLQANNLSKTSGYKIKLAEENLPLKRFVRDSETNLPFTGYIVKKKNLYYYKVNKVGVKVNRSMVMMHERFKNFLRDYSIPEHAIAPLKKQLAYTYESSTTRHADIKKALAGKLTEVNTKLEKLEERHAFGEINLDVYNKYTAKLLEEKASLTDELEKLTIKLSNPKELFDFVCRFASRIATVWTSANYHQKQMLQNMLFPTGIHYDAKIEQYRTPTVRFIFERMACLVRRSGEKKNGNFDFDLESSRLVDEGFTLSNLIAELEWVERFMKRHKLLVEKLV